MSAEQPGPSGPPEPPQAPDTVQVMDTGAQPFLTRAARRAALESRPDVELPPIAHVTRVIGIPATVIGALLIAVSIKRRQEAGLLDGDEHYDIGRALAYGYFKNFLVGALILAQEKRRKLYVFKPGSVADLRAFENEVWPEAARKIQPRAEEMDFSARGRSTPLVRRIVVIGSTTGAGEELWMDFPTTLFTVGDYYESWNRWLKDNNRPYVARRQQAEFEQKQINAFFRHLRLLISTDIGRKAVEEFGLTTDELVAMQTECYVELSLQRFRAQLQQVEAPPAGAARA